MSLSAGQRLGPYEITAPLGAGGMGEVFRARDTKLDREVAVKVLPARLAEDEEALARFEREAKSVAALSHPGILAIHDFGREAGTAYAVMELPARVERPARPVDGGGGRLGGGTGRVEVTNDAALDWSPSWAPDGRHLYFSSTRGGTMNLWRVPIDEATGQVLGAPEPVTTPSLWRGNPSLARDGRPAAFASLDWRSTLLRAAFDPAREELVGPPTPVLRSTQAIRDHAVSPDGQWVALSGAGAQEDLLVARIDGSQYRRLTDDTFRDRGPSWAPDGRTIAFYSDRGGAYEIWSIRPDGSGIEQLTPSSDAGGMNFPVWSPDGSRLAVGTIPGNWTMFDRTAGAVAGTAMPAPGESTFWPLSWSPDGRRMAGLNRGADGSIQGIGLFSLQSGRYEAGPVEGHAMWLVTRWLRDSRRLLVRDARGISIVDTATWRQKRIVTVGGYMIGHSAGISRDDRFITWTETATEGDVWLMNLQ